MRTGFWIQLAFLFIRRSWRSTLVLGVMVCSAVAALIFLTALAVGTNDAMIRNSVGLFSGHISVAGLPPTTGKNRLAVPGVKAVLLRKGLPVWLERGDRAETLVLTGVAPDEEKRWTALWRKTVGGHYPQEGEAGIFLSDVVAKRLGVKTGEDVRYGPRPGVSRGRMTVCGLYHTGIADLDHGLAFCAMPALPAGEGTLSAAVFLEDGVLPETVLRAYRGRFEASSITSWTEFMPDLKQLIDLNFISMGIVMVLVFGVVSLGISCAFVIFILKNLREHGIMKAMGVLPAESAVLIAAQVMSLTLIAALCGTTLGALAVLGFGRMGIDLTVWTSHNPYFVVSGVIYPRLTAFSLWLPPLLALFCSMIAAVWPSALVIRKRAAEILRSV